MLSDVSISTQSKNSTFAMKESPSGSVLATSDTEFLSQNTGVKTRKALFVGEDTTRLVWIGYGEGRCLSHWALGDDYDPFVETSRISLSSDPYDLCFLPNSLFALSSSSGELLIVNADNNRLQQVRSYSNVNGTGDSRVLSVSNKTLYSGSSNGTVASVDLESVSVNKFNTGFSGVRSLSVLSGGSLLATGHSSGHLLVWDTREFSTKPCVVTPSKTQLDAVTAICTHPAQANIIAFGTDNGAVGFCDVRGTSDILPLTYDIATATVTQVLFHPHRNDHLVCSSTDGSIVHWDASMVNNNVYSSVPASSRNSPWLSEKLGTSVRLSVLRPESFSAINSIDICGETVVAASDIMSIFAFPSVKFDLSPSLR